MTAALRDALDADPDVTDPRRYLAPARLGHAGRRPPHPSTRWADHENPRHRCSPRPVALGSAATVPRTAARSPVPRTLYVSPTGDDRAAGTRRRSAAYASGGRRPAGRAAASCGCCPAPTAAPGSCCGAVTTSPSPPPRPGAAVLDERGLVPLDGQSGVVQIQNSSRITVRGLDIRGYRTTSMAKVPIGIYVTGHGSRDHRWPHNHVHRLGNDNPTLGSFDINAHGIAVYGDSPHAPDHPPPDPRQRGRPPAPRRQRERRGQRQRRPAGGSPATTSTTTTTSASTRSAGRARCPGRHRYAAVDRARTGVIAGNTVSRIISRGNPAYWEGDGWCNCADGIYVDGGGHIDVRDNVVRDQRHRHRGRRGEPARPRRRRPRTPQPGQRQRLRRSRARRLQPEPRRGVRRAGHRQPLPRRQHPATTAHRSCCCSSSCTRPRSRATPSWPPIAPPRSCSSATAWSGRGG